MKYAVRINKRIRYLRTYTIVKKVGEKQNIIMKLLFKLLAKGNKNKGVPV